MNREADSGQQLRLNAKLERKREREQKKLDKQQRKMEYKKLKWEQKKKVKNARVYSLSDGILDQSKPLIINIDGYNIMGCDKVCKRLLKNNEIDKAKERLNMLMNNFNAGNNVSVGYQVKTQIWFVNNSDIISKSCTNSNGNLLFVTSDRKLTLELAENGVKVMKSGIFYKKYLSTKNNANNGNYSNNNNNNNNDNINDDDSKDGELSYETNIMNPNDGDDVTFARLAIVDDNGNENNTSSNDDNINNPTLSDDDIDGEFDMLEQELNEGIPDEVST